MLHGSITFPVQEFDDPDVFASDGFTIHAVEHETLLYESDHCNGLLSPDGTSVAVGSETHILGEDGEIVILDAGLSFRRIRVARHRAGRCH